MAFLTIAGITIPVAVASGATKKAPETGGADSRAFAGNLRTTVRYEKRNWQFTTTPLLDAAAAAIETACAGGAFVTVAGDAVGGVNVTCRITVGDGGYTKVHGTFRRVLVLTAREV